MTVGGIRSDRPSDKFDFYSDLRLVDGTVVPICGNAAIEEIGFLIQEKYSNTRTLLKGTVEQPDPNTAEGRVIIERRQRYLDLLFKDRKHKINSRVELEDLFNDEERDGLVALACRGGHRHFEDGPPPKIVDANNLKIDPKTGRYPLWVPSNHACLLTFDEDDDQFYVYDSDDPDGKWPVTVEGSGDQFSIRWRIDDHMGNGPSQQIYYDVRPLNRLLGEIRGIAEDPINSGH